MRLWHIDLIEYLPDKQLLGQWRELNSIYVKQDKHILINYIYEYGKADLLYYSQVVLKEMEKRGFKFSLKNYDEYFKEFDEEDRMIKPENWLIVCGVFYKHMDERYLQICCWNLYEKLIRGQEGFSNDCFVYLITNMKKHLGDKI